VQRRHVAPAGELQERTQRGQPQVAAANRVVSLALQMIQERQDQIRLDVDQLQLLGSLPSLAGEVQEQHQGIAVAGHRARAERALRNQVLGEELLNQRRRTMAAWVRWRYAWRTSDGASNDSNRPAASAINSGAAERYQ
jgi:hypothetical protein